MGQSKKKSEKSSCFIMVLLVLALVVAMVAAITAPTVIRLQKTASLASTTHNAKQVFLSLFEFDQDYGCFPGDSTARIHRRDGSSYQVDDWRSYKGDSSNDYLGQLLAAERVSDKSVFLAPQTQSERSKDGQDMSVSKTIEAGECGFSYVKNQSTNDDTGRPLLLAPMTGEGGAFDPDPYDGLAVVLRIDGAAKQLRINEDGLARVGKGKTLFESGPETVWGEDGFDPSMLVHPKPQQWIDGRGSSWTARILLALLMIGLVRLFLRRRPQRPQENA